jgi:D-amino-acid dehydrogenase
MTPDSRPIIGATPISNLFLNCGHGMLGWTLACGSAELAAAAIMGETQTMDEDFSLARF